MRTGEVYFSRATSCFYEILMGEDKTTTNFVKITFPSGQIRHTIIDPDKMHFYVDLEPCDLIDEQESLDALVRTTV